LAKLNTTSGCLRSKLEYCELLDLKTSDAESIAAAVSATTSDPGFEVVTFVKGLFSVMSSGLSQHYSDSGSPT
ncbi:hypothetical protein Tco_0552597, partial [Tanacetum coccineum]